MLLLLSAHLLAHSIYNDILPQPHKRNKIDNTAVERRSNDNKNVPPNRKIARRSKAIATYGRMMILKGVLFCWIADEVYSLATSHVIIRRRYDFLAPCR